METRSELMVREESRQVDTLAERKLRADDQIQLATHWAKKLMEVVQKCNLSQDIGGKKYLEVEGWQMIGEFAHVTAVLDWTRPWLDQNGVIQGYEARANLLNEALEIIGSGESSCGFDGFPCRGKKGSEIDKAARSAAQTWAISRAFRNKFSYVAKIAGFEPVPAEEMGQSKVDRRAPLATPGANVPPKNYISLLGVAILDFCNDDKKGAKEVLQDIAGVDSLTKLNQGTAEAAYKNFEKKYLAQGDVEPGGEG